MTLTGSTGIASCRFGGLLLLCWLLLGAQALAASLSNGSEPLPRRGRILPSWS